MGIGRGVMAVWNDLESGHEAEFDAWYQRQHVPERLSVPGFIEARRYFTEHGSPRYCAFYWLDHVGTLNTPTYLDRLASPTRWTRRMMPRFRAMARSPCTVTLDHGCGIGGSMAWLAASGGSITDVARLRAALSQEFAACALDPAIVRMQLWECDLRLAALANPEQRLRVASDHVSDWIVFIEGASAHVVTECQRRFARAITRAGFQAAIVSSPAYRLTWRVLAGEAPPPCADEEAGVTWNA